MVNALSGTMRGFFSQNGSQNGAGSTITPSRPSREDITNALTGAKDAINTAIGFSPAAGTLPRGQTTILEFPLDVASGDAALGNHGHYIMFYINAF